jgi:1-acyl-sn-glycerol-3-phosphate acyltransferase
MISLGLIMRAEACTPVKDGFSMNEPDASQRGRHEVFDPHLERRWRVRLLHLGDRLISRIYHHLIVLSPQQLPSDGPAILICNHTSGLDPLLIQSVCKRVIIWMMAKEYYNIGPLTPIFRTLQIIPVDRAARDTSAVRSAMRALQAGCVLGMFPEGRIETTRELLPFQPGVAQMAIKTGVPVYPAFVDGTQHGTESMVGGFAHRQEATLRFGAPLKFDRRANVESATNQLRDAIWALRSERY